MQPGSRVRLHVALTLADGTVAESTFDSEPLELVIGDGTLVKGLEIALYGLRPGQRQTLTLHPDQAYGARDAEAVGWLPREQFPADMPLQPGTLVGFVGPQGEEVAALVLAVEAERVQIDFNHPLAGKPIVFETEILAVEPPAEATDDESA
ncbi:MAG: peptidylprolyl isomerase [Gammaproteobacteria bacterium]|nr:peptidylprolyl isomerase [Gammaproteobacteria bacterium]